MNFNIFSVCILKIALVNYIKFWLKILLDQTFKKQNVFKVLYFSKKCLICILFFNSKSIIAVKF